MFANHLVKPQIETYYGVDYTVVSLLFLTSFVGYLAAALSSNLIHHHFGQRGVAVLAPLCRLVGYVIMALHPPYPVLPVILLFPGFGNGLEDSAWNAWIGNLQNANELLGILHGAYGAGATIAPLIATAVVTRGNPPLHWFTYYYIMVGVSILEACLTTTAFWGANAAAFRDKHAAYQQQTGGSRTTTRTVLREPITGMVALFLLGYVGAEVSLGGWITTFSTKLCFPPLFLFCFSFISFFPSFLFSFLPSSSSPLYLLGRMFLLNILSTIIFIIQVN